MNKSRPLTNCQRRGSYDHEEDRHTLPHHVVLGLGWRGRELPPDGVLVERKSALDGPWSHRAKTPLQ